MDLFAEILPIKLESLPKFTVYQIKTIGSESPDKIGRKLSYQLKRNFSRHWHWDKMIQCLIADSQLSQDNLNTFIQQLWQGKDDIYKKSLESMIINNDIQPSKQGIADFVAKTLLGDVYPQIRQILGKHKLRSCTYPKTDL